MSDELLDTGETGPRDPQRLPLPEETQPIQIMWQYVIILALLHLVALLAFYSTDRWVPLHMVRAGRPRSQVTSFLACLASRLAITVY